MFGVSSLHHIGSGVPTSSPQRANRGEGTGRSRALRSTTRCRWLVHRVCIRPLIQPRYSFVWDASRKLYMEMVAAEGWTAKSVIEVPNVHTLTSKASLLVEIFFKTTAHVMHRNSSHSSYLHRLASGFRLHGPISLLTKVK
jgi:hypothetical protein